MAADMHFSKGRIVVTRSGEHMNGGNLNFSHCEQGILLLHCSGQHVKSGEIPGRKPSSFGPNI